MVTISRATKTGNSNIIGADAEAQLFCNMSTPLCALFVYKSRNMRHRLFV